MREVVGGEDLGDLGLERTEFVEFFEVVDLESLDVPVVVLDDDEEVEDPDDPGLR